MNSDPWFTAIFALVGFPIMFAFSWWWTCVCIRWYRRMTR